MLSIDLIRREPDLVRQALEARGETDPLGEILELDAQRRRAVTEGDDLRAERNRVSRALGQARASGEEPSQETVEEMRRVRERVDRLEQQARELEEGINTILLGLPNIPLPDVPPGEGEEENVVVRRWGEPRRFDFTPLPHWELGESLGLIDFQRGVKLSGSRFFTMFGPGAKLERALISWMLDLHTEEHGYTEVMLPHLVKREAMEGSGNLPKFSDNLYHDEEDDLWFVPTAEVPLTNMHRDEIILPGRLPIYYVAYTACFRREKMSAGKDTRGIKRGHQFDKVELYKFTEPDKSNDELEKMVANAEAVCQKLVLPYRVKELCTADLGFASTKSYDIEMWAPGCGEWLEVSSLSNCGNFQAQRANIRYRPSPEAKPQFTHTLNGSGLALPRVLIAIMETYQQADGSIAIPEVLQDYVGEKMIK